MAKKSKIIFHMKRLMEKDKNNMLKLVPKNDIVRGGGRK